ncbi:uncharacterized protein M421DRAFT_10755 [Didymella exigua CBS 183.55]|uniref:C2H2-type domain-containing protein n=1 Tax=Didymella exigua CBS 183.55 TaxID=1150837 RepID=A0A6A5R281_9PLEO|nr:uncharacterized protein M421DRAFT_10755 [Didymella exigua CBS 183.55]KAF1922185.1 hypothetical protein M421DRAFT_10755 [Didymella exigua CBS 183.55]
MFTYLPLYGVLVCQEHCYAVYNLDEHLKRLHKLPSAERRRLIASYSGLALSPPERVPAPEPYGPPVAELGAPQSAFLCCQAAQQGADDNHLDTTTTTLTTTSSSSSNQAH